MIIARSFVIIITHMNEKCVIAYSFSYSMGFHVKNYVSVDQFIRFFKGTDVSITETKSISHLPPPPLNSDSHFNKYLYLILGILAWQNSDEISCLFAEPVG